MTNEEASEELRCFRENMLLSLGRIEALDMAIKALEQQPCEDCISREEAINEADNLSLETSYDNEKVEQMLRDLPSVQPKYTDEEIDKAQAVEQAYVDKMVESAVEETKRPKGKWIEIEVRNVYATLKCSVCGRVIEPIFDFCKYSYEDIKRSYPYCHCGAEMTGGTDD